MKRGPANRTKKERLEKKRAVKAKKRAFLRGSSSQCQLLIEIFTESLKPVI